MNMRSVLLGTTLLALASAPAMAYNVSTCLGTPQKWHTNNVTMRASPVSFPTGYWRNGLQRTVDLINANPTPFFFTLATDTGNLALKNGQNEIWGSTSASILQGSPAITYTQKTCFWLFGVVSHIDEADVIFDYNAPFQWTADEVKTSLIRYTGTKRQLQGTGVHELGHAMGLLHENRVYNVMGDDFTHIWANGSAAHGYLGENAADGTVFLYGLWTHNYEDLGVSHWKYSGKSGEYSTHVRTGVYNTAGALLPAVQINGEPGYKVNRGQTVQVEFTYENNGKTKQIVNTGWYLSTNDLISSTDRLLATNTGMSLTRDNVLTYRRTLQIPTNLTPKTKYWLGTIVDKDHRVSDAVPSNNATYIPIMTN